MIYDKLFIGGDLSGIQKFLYNITSRKAAVSLKGRSASLSDEMKNVYKTAIDAVIRAGGKITPDDMLYCSGGKFFFKASINADSQDRVCKALDNCLVSFRKYFWQEHRGLLGVNICYVAFNEKDDFINVEGKYGEPPYVGTAKGPGQLWKVISAGFAQQKNQRFRELILSDYDNFFGHGDQLKMKANRKICAVSGIEFDTTNLDKTRYTITYKGTEIIVLPSVMKQIEKGETLRNDPKRGFLLFEQYATTDIGRLKGNEGDTYLAILRMDVDGLGKRFIVGFSSFREYKKFSNNLYNFFEKNVEDKLLNKKIDGSIDSFKQYLNVIYAGGDDLFIVGRWDKVIEFAKLIHDETEKRFAAEGISISGGIAIVKPKFPISKAAELAGEAEELAKHYSQEKNAFHMFGKTISWNRRNPYPPNVKNQYNHEFAYVEHFKNRFVEYISKYNTDFGFSKSILHKIMLYAYLAEINKERMGKGKSPDYSYLWHISYHLTRFMDRFKDYRNERDNTKRIIKEELYKFCCNLRDEQLLGNKGRNLQLIAVAARWAELLLQDKEISL